MAIKKVLFFISVLLWAYCLGAQFNVTQNDTSVEKMAAEYTVAQFIPVAVYEKKTPTDPCLSGTPPAIGTTCTSGTIYAGIFDGGKYMVTPTGCTNSTTPTCAGGSETVTKTWAGGGSTAGIAGVEDVALAEDFSSPAYRGDVNTSAAMASGNPTASSAVAFCANMDYAGYTDWYLPSKSELTYIICKAATGSSGSDAPPEVPACTQYGGRTYDIPMTHAKTYLTSTENTTTWNVWSYWHNNAGWSTLQSKTNARNIRCVRRYDEASVDKTPNAISIADFNDTSAAQLLSGFTETIFLEFTSVDVSGAPTVLTRVNTDSWKNFTAGGSVLLAVRAGDTIELRVTGNVTDSTTITIKNATDNVTKPTIDTIVGTVTDACGGVPSVGATCAGGALFAGVFDGGKYMVTPGNCTDSSTPTCDGTTDTLTKTWQGSTGSSVDIIGVENVSAFTVHSSPSYRGNVNTPAIVADASTSSDSAADYCNNMTYGNYSDWYLPSKTEMAHIYCHTSAPGHVVTEPGEDPNCVQLGGKTSELTSFSGAHYQTSSENTSLRNYVQSFLDGKNKDDPKSKLVLLRCIRRYDESLVDFITDDGWSFTNFTGSSTTNTVSAFDETIFVELTAVNNTGTPTLEYSLNGGAWTTFTVGSSTLIAVRAGNTMQFRATGVTGHSATITIKNATNSFSTMDTVTGTVP